MKVENGKQFIILLNKRGFNQSAYQTLRSVKHSLIKRPIIHLLTSKASMFLNCQILFLFNYVMLMFFVKLIQKRAWVTKSKQLNSSSLCIHDKSVHMCKCDAFLRACSVLYQPSRYRDDTRQEELNSVKLAGLDKAITLPPHLKRTHYFVLERVELYC